MTVTYSTAPKVSAFLQLTEKDSLNTRLVFDGTTSPTKDEVEALINETEDFLDKETGHAWRSVSIANEYHDFPETFLDRFGKRVGKIYLKHRKITTFVSSTDKLEIWDGSSWTDWVASASYNEGTGPYDDDFFVDYDAGIIMIHTLVPQVGEKTVRITYRYGESSVPLDIQKAATILVALVLMQTDDYVALFPEGLDSYPIASKADKLESRAKRIIANHKEAAIIDY